MFYFPSLLSFNCFRLLNETLNKQSSTSKHCIKSQPILKSMGFLIWRFSVVSDDMGIPLINYIPLNSKINLKGIVKKGTISYKTLNINGHCD